MVMIKAGLNQIKASTALLVLCIKDGNQSSNNQKLESMLKFLHDYLPLPSSYLAGLKGGGGRVRREKKLGLKYTLGNLNIIRSGIKISK